MLLFFHFSVTWNDILDLELTLFLNFKLKLLVIQTLIWYTSWLRLLIISPLGNDMPSNPQNKYYSSNGERVIYDNNSSKVTQMWR